MRRNNLIKHGVLKKVIIFAMALMVVSSPNVYRSGLLETRASNTETIDTDSKENDTTTVETTSVPTSDDTSTQSGTSEITAESDNSNGTNNVETGVSDRVSTEVGITTNNVNSSLNTTEEPIEQYKNDSTNISTLGEIQGTYMAETPTVMSEEANTDVKNTVGATVINSQIETNGAIRVAVTDEEGNTSNKVIGTALTEGDVATDITLTDYVKEQVVEAVNAKDEAQKNLEAALAVATKEEAQEYVDATVEAAQKAQEAADAAKKVVDAAKQQTVDAINVYNAYAILLGEPYYGCTKENPGYTEEERIKAEKMAQDAKLDEAIEQVQDTVLEDQGSVIETTEAVVYIADTDYQVAQSAADTASKAVEQVQDKIIGEEVTDIDKEVVIPSVDQSNGDEENSIVSQEITTVIASSEETFETQLAEYNSAVAQVAGLKKTLALTSNSLQDIDLKALKAKIKTAEKQAELAGYKLYTATAAVNTAKLYEKWATQLVTEQKADSFAQISEAGIPLENIYDYDLTDATVESHNITNFQKISTGRESIVVPYSVYRAYIQSAYKLGANKEVCGTGIAYNVNDNNKASLEPLYWVVGTDGKLTGDYFTSTEGLPNGQYFIAYTFKSEYDGYHFDGYLFNYTDRPSAPAPTPDDETGTTGGGTGTTGGGFTTAATNGAAVLGATRAANGTSGLTTIGDDPTALAATPEAAVLGAERNPQTGDTTNVWVWLVGMLTSTTLLAGWGIKNRKGKKEEKEDK